MTLQYDISTSSDPEKSGITLVFSDGHIETVSAGHPEHDTIRDIITTTPLDEIDEDELKGLAKPISAVGAKLTALSERVSTDGNHIYFDGDVIDGTIENHILREIKSEDHQPIRIKSIVNFLEKLSTNPSNLSKEALYAFINRYNLTLTADGDFIAYKGLNSDFGSIHQGYGIVDKRVYNGHLPNKPGSIVEFPRQKVDADGDNGCSTGLHAGSYEYAKAFANGVLVTVKINPRDVVSVPHDHDYAKLRVSRYEVLSSEAVKIETPFFASEGISYDYDETDHSITALSRLHDEMGDVPVLIDGDSETVVEVDFEDTPTIYLEGGEKLLFDEIDHFKIAYEDIQLNNEDPDNWEDDDEWEDSDEDEADENIVGEDLLKIRNATVLNPDGSPKYEVEVTATSVLGEETKTHTGQLLQFTPEGLAIQLEPNLTLALPLTRVLSVIVSEEI